MQEILETARTPSMADSLDSAISFPSEAVVLTENIEFNTRLLQKHTGTPLIAVIKADGFGLGGIGVARAVLSGGAAELGVATIEEALALRDAGITAPILSWLLYPGARIAQAIEKQITLSCSSLEHLDWILREMPHTPDKKVESISLGLQNNTPVLPCNLEIEIETGLRRSGSELEDLPRLLAAISDAQQQGLVRLQGIWTHFANTLPLDRSHSQQLSKLKAARQLAEHSGFPELRSHAASSLAAITTPVSRLDCVRIGAALFGIEPVTESPIGLKPVVRWTTRVTQTRFLAAGNRIGYGGDYVTQTAGWVALIPVGYADGVPRNITNIAVTINGRSVPLVGSIAMDQCVVFLGDQSCAIGDEVVLIGDQSRNETSLHQWAEAAGTIPQEILTGLGTRVKRSLSQASKI